jgi:NADH-ubiquinone oxidoreductase chain 5
MFGSILAFFLYNFQSHFLYRLKTSTIGRKIYSFLNKKWFFDKIYNEIFGQFFFKFGYSVSYKTIDRAAFEIMGPTGLSSVALKASSNLHKLQTNSIYHYTLIILFTTVAILCVRQLSLLFDYGIDHRLFILGFIATFFATYSNE